MCLVVSCNAIFLVRNYLAGFLPFGLIKVGAQLQSMQQWSSPAPNTDLVDWRHFSTNHPHTGTLVNVVFWKLFLTLPSFAFLWRCETRLPPMVTHTAEHDTGKQTTWSSQYLWFQCVFRTFFHTQRESQAEREFIFPRKLRNSHLFWTTNKTRTGFAAVPV